MTTGVVSDVDDVANTNTRKTLRQDALRAANNCPDTPNEAPLFTMGVLADIQYADIEDGHSFSGRPRYYRHSLEAARAAAEHFQDCKVNLVVNLGDIVDGKCRDAMGEDGGHIAVDAVVDALSAYEHGRIIHTYGNHELYNLSREDIGKKLGIPFVRENEEDLVGYHSFRERNIRFVVLDTYDIAILGRCPEMSRKRKKAERLLSTHNPNYPLEENSPEGMTELQKRYVAFNGGVDTAQLRWLRETLQQAKDNGEYAIVLSHQPIHPASTNPVCLVWNYVDVLDILREYRGTVVASFAGHAHRGGYAQCEESGIHFRVFEAALESRHPLKTYGFVDFHDDRLVVRGEGDCESAVYHIKQL